MPRKAKVAPLEGALESLGGLIASCTPENQPSEAVLRTFTALLDRKEGVGEAEAKSLMERLRRVEMQAGLLGREAQTNKRRHSSLLGGRNAP